MNAMVVALAAGAVARVLWDRYLCPFWDEFRDRWEHDN